jgi:hypothetical protein
MGYIFFRFANMCDDPALVGRLFLAGIADGATSPLQQLMQPRVAWTVSLEVTLLIRAHSCFVLVCTMDGIESVMQLAKRRVAVYAEQEQYEALVRLLTGVKKFREMEYILDLLIAKDKFELLLSKRLLLHDGPGAIELKMALRDYLLRRQQADDIDRLEMVSLHFSMHREIGENRFNTAVTCMHRLGRQPPGLVLCVLVDC